MRVIEGTTLFEWANSLAKLFGPDRSDLVRALKLELQPKFSPFNNYVRGAKQKSFTIQDVRRWVGARQAETNAPKHRTIQSGIYIQSQNHSFYQFNPPPQLQLV